MTFGGDDNADERAKEGKATKDGSAIVPDSNGKDAGDKSGDQAGEGEKGGEAGAESVDAAKDGATAVEIVVEIYDDAELHEKQKKEILAGVSKIFKEAGLKDVTVREGDVDGWAGRWTGSMFGGVKWDPDDNVFPVRVSDMKLMKGRDQIAGDTPIHKDRAFSDVSTQRNGGKDGCIVPYLANLIAHEVGHQMLYENVDEHHGNAYLGSLMQPLSWEKGQVERYATRYESFDDRFAKRLRDKFN